MVVAQEIQAGEFSAIPHLPLDQSGIVAAVAMSLLMMAIAVNLMKDGTCVVESRSVGHQVLNIGVALQPTRIFRGFAGLFLAVTDGNSPSA
jgi:hypothetical protein